MTCPILGEHSVIHISAVGLGNDRYLVKFGADRYHLCNRRAMAYFFARESLFRSLSMGDAFSSFSLRESSTKLLISFV